MNTQHYSHRPQLRAALADRFNGLTEGPQLKTFSVRLGNRAEIIKESRSHDASIEKPGDLQSFVRSVYSKPAPTRAQSIGDHPDFLHLKANFGEEHCAITTLFMDLENSSRLGLLYPLHDVYRIKNAFILVAIEIVQAFDGHVHRIMGDAVMAYFGGRTGKPEDAIASALNAASLIRYFVESVVLPRFNQEGYGDAFGIRIGLDHGKEPDVLWSCYGYGSTTEVTATSFYVDVASKLQHAAGRNQIMIGQSLRDFMDFPEDLLSVKHVQKDGVELPEPYLLPNLTRRNGEAINYRKFLLRWNEFLRYSPIGQIDNALGGSNLLVTCNTAAVYRGTFVGEYVPAASVVMKGQWLAFHVSNLIVPPLPYQVKYKVQNHGVEATLAASKANHPARDDHEEIVTVNTLAEHQQLTHWEHAGYRGLHYLIVETMTQPVQRVTFGVFVEQRVFTKGRCGR
jgi:adenylate cyclase